MNSDLGYEVHWAWLGHVVSKKKRILIHETDDSDDDQTFKLSSNWKSELNL